MAMQGANGEREEVSWELDSTTVYGSLVRPAGAGPCTALVMVDGSGPTGRGDRELQRAGARLDPETMAAIVGWLSDHS